jgi:hypothetical protein
MVAKSAGGKGVSPAIIGVAGVVVVGLVGWLAYVNLFAPPGPPPMNTTPVEQQTTNTMQSLAKKCQGDFSKLSPEDQAAANKIAGGYAALAISKLYQSSAGH